MLRPRQALSPTILETAAGRYLDGYDAKKVEPSYMITAFAATPLGIEHLRGAMHQADHTIRPQLLLEDTNPSYYRTVKAFERREGLPVGNVRVVYNGCGTLVGQMQAGQRPDAFFACDAKYLDDPLKKDDPDGKKIKDLFLDATEISKNKLVIMVPKGNPKKIRGLRDLTRKGMRIGVGDEHKCAMGALTEETFKQGNIRGRVNIVVRSGTGDMLVNQLRTGSLDAVVAYVSNAVPAADQLEALAIDIPCALSVQPVAARKDSPYRQLTLEES